MAPPPAVPCFTHRSRCLHGRRTCRAAGASERCGIDRYGFTLVELLVVIAIISTLLLIAAPRYFGSVRQAQEATLRKNLALMRDAIDKHFDDSGRYPDALEDLVSKRYLRTIPVDGNTGTAATWIVVPPANPELGRVYDVKSGSTENARDGSALNTW